MAGTITLYGKLIPDSPKDYPIVDSKYIKGGVSLVSTKNKLQTDIYHPQKGMLVYVEDEDCYYQYKEESTWEAASLGGLLILDNEKAANALPASQKKDGTLVFIKDKKAFYVHITNDDNTEEWKPASEYITLKNPSNNSEQPVSKAIETILQQGSALTQSLTRLTEDLKTNTIWSKEDTTEIKVGGLAKGSNLKGKTVVQILDGMLYPEYLPQFTDATAPTIAITNAGQYYNTFKSSYTNGASLEVGNPLIFASYLKASAGTPCKAEASGTDNSATGGSGTCESITICNDSTWGFPSSSKLVYTRQAGTFKCQVTCTYSAGTEPVKTSKGNNTQYTASNKETLVADGTTTSNTALNSNKQYVLASTTKTSYYTIYYKYPFYATTGTTIGEGVKAGFITSPWTVALTGGGKEKTMCFWLPPDKTLTAVKSIDVNNNYTLVQTDNFEKSQETKNINGVSSTYTKYSYKGNSTAAFKIQVTFS